MMALYQCCRCWPFQQWSISICWECYGTSWKKWWAGCGEAGRIETTPLRKLCWTAVGWPSGWAWRVWGKQGPGQAGIWAVALEDMKADYEHMTAELREEYRLLEITESFEKFKTVFKGLSDSYNNQIYQLMASIHRKFYGQGAQHEPACNDLWPCLLTTAMLINHLRSCDKEPTLRLMTWTQSWPSWLTSKWETVTASENIPGTPIDSLMESSFENDGGLIGGKKQYVIENLRDRHEPKSTCGTRSLTTVWTSWRVRIIERISWFSEMTRATLFQSNGTTFGKEIQIQIRYPTISTIATPPAARGASWPSTLPATLTTPPPTRLSTGRAAVWLTRNSYKKQPALTVSHFQDHEPRNFCADELAQVSFGFSGSRIIKGNGKKSNPFWSAIASRRGRRQIRSPARILRRITGWVRISSGQQQYPAV